MGRGVGGYMGGWLPICHSVALHEGLGLGGGGSPYGSGLLPLITSRTKGPLRPIMDTPMIILISRTLDSVFTKRKMCEMRMMVGMTRTLIVNALEVLMAAW